MSEALNLHPANIYGQYKLEAEQRVLELCPDSVHLRASWMYDLPGYGLPIRGNLPLNLLRAALNLVMDAAKLERSGIRFAATQQGIRCCLQDYGLSDL